MSIVATRTAESEQDALLATRVFKSLANMVLSLPRSVGIQARSDADQLIAKANLGDGAAPATDLWNGVDPLAAVRAKLVGPEQAASGSGAEKMVSDYSTDLQPGDSLTRAYAEFAQALGQVADIAIEARKSAHANAKTLAQQTRALEAITCYIKGEPVPENKSGAETGDREDKDDDGEIDKAGNVRVLSIGSIPHLMRSLAAKPAPGSEFPPDMTGGSIRKSAVPFEQALDDMQLNTSERIAASGIRQLARFAAFGDQAMVNDLRRRTQAAGSRVVEALRMSGVI